MKVLRWPFLLPIYTIRTIRIVCEMSVKECFGPAVVGIKRPFHEFIQFLVNFIGLPAPSGRISDLAAINHFAPLALPDTK